MYSNSLFMLKQFKCLETQIHLLQAQMSNWKPKSSCQKPKWVSANSNRVAKSPNECLEPKSNCRKPKWVSRNPNPVAESQNEWLETQIQLQVAQMSKSAICHQNPLGESNCLMKSFC